MVRFCGRVMLSSALQLLKAEEPMEVTPEGILIVFKVLQ